MSPGGTARPQALPPLFCSTSNFSNEKSERNVEKEKVQNEMQGERMIKISKSLRVERDSASKAYIDLLLETS